MSKKFPTDFLWGASTSAYQVEGGWDADSKGPSIQDIRTNIPEGTSNFKVASDHYNRWKEDVALFSELGLKSYRFSVSWARIFPDDSNIPNPKGIEFYKNLVKKLKLNNIEPIVTMYHFDLPNWLEEKGGWANKEITKHFETYAAYLFKELGEDVKY